MIKFLAAVIAGLWIFYQYHQKIEDDKKLKSLEVIIEFKKSKEYTRLVEQDLMFLTPLVARESDEAQAESKKANSLCPYKRHIDKLLTGRQSPEAQYRLFVALDQIAVCANSGVCKASVLCDFLGRPIRVHLTTFCTFYDGIERLGRLRIRYNLRQFLTSCKKYYYYEGRDFDDRLYCDYYPLSNCQEGRACRNKGRVINTKDEDPYKDCT